MNLEMIALPNSAPRPQPSLVEEPHYSDRILTQLVFEHGWELLLTGRSAFKDFSDGTTANPVKRQFIATFDDRGRYLTFEAGWQVPFDIDARDRDIAGVAAEFDERATRWAKRELGMPNLPQFVRTALGHFEATDVQRTAATFDAILGAAAQAAGAELDDETRLNAHHLCSGACRGYGSLQEFRLPKDIPHVARRRDDGVAEEVHVGGLAVQAADLLTQLDAQATLPMEKTRLAELLHAFGVGAGRAFDLMHGCRYQEAAAAMRAARDFVVPCARMA